MREARTRAESARGVPRPDATMSWAGIAHAHGFLRGLLLAAVAALGCSYSDHASIEADSLTVTPCRDDQPRTFAPYRLDAGLLRWFAAEGVGTLEARAGYRAATISDAIIVQFGDTEEVRRRLAADPSAAFAVDGSAVRLSLVLAETCPDATQPLVASAGTLTLSSFEPWKGGRIEGRGTVDLVDAREVAQDPAARPLVRGARVEFSMKVRSGPPHEDFTLWP